VIFRRWRSFGRFGGVVEVGSVSAKRESMLDGSSNLVEPFSPKTAAYSEPVHRGPYAEFLVRSSLYSRYNMS
jgi:hypothetical protein